MKCVLLLIATTAILSAGLFATMSNASERRTVAEFDIVISLDRESERIVLSCAAGCAWTDITFPCSAESACSAEIDSFGVVAPANSDLVSGRREVVVAFTVPSLSHA